MLSSSLNTPAATVLLSSEALNVVTSATHSAAVTESVSENESERDGEEDGPGVGGSHCHPCVQWVVRVEGGDFGSDGVVWLPKYVSCPKKQEPEVRLSREHPTELACLQELLKRLQDCHGECTQVVAKLEKAAADVPNVIQAMILFQEAKH